MRVSNARLARRVLFVSDTPLVPTQQGDAARFMWLVQLLRRRGCHVSWLQLDDGTQPIVCAPATSIGLYWWRAVDAPRTHHADSLAPDDWCPDELVEATGHACAQLSPDIVYVAQTHLSKCFVALSKEVVRILDNYMFPVHRRDKFAAAGVPHPWFSTDRTHARVALDRADVLVAVDSDEALALIDLMPAKPVIVVGYDTSAVPSHPPIEPIVGVIAAANDENTAGITTFLERAWPIVLHKEPNAVLRIAGGVCNALRPTVEGKQSVELVGIVDSVDAFFENVRVAINPNFVGTGVKIKSVEALRHGRPLVTLMTGAVGLGDASGAVFVARDFEGLGIAAAELLGDATKTSAASRAALHWCDAVQPATAGLDQLLSVADRLRHARAGRCNDHGG